MKSGRNSCLIVLMVVLFWGCSTSAPLRPGPAVSETAPVVRAPSEAGPPAAPAFAGKREPGQAPVAPGRDDTGEEGIVEDDDVENLAAPKGRETALSRALYLCRVAQNYWKRGELENAIDTLDNAYALVLKVDPGNDPTLMQEKEDLRFTISKRILEIYSSRHVVVNGKRNEIPLIINRHVQEEIDSFTIGRERDFFIDSYRRSGKYKARIEVALKDAGLPAELAWLPLIESGFKVTALSPARALGLWQFIPSTGYRYNLNRDTYVDERLDPEKATRGAIEYLKELHGMFGDWTTVLAAYNCGENRVLRTIQSQNINYLDNFWDLYERLPRETARYVPRFLATLHIVQSPAQYGLGGVVAAAPLTYETVSVPRQASLRAVAQTAGIDEDLLRELNAELRQGVLPDDGYELRVPPGEGARLLARLDDIPAYRPRPAITVIQHKVRKGESLDTIARKYKIEAKTIMLANNIRRPGPLSAGSSLRIPLEWPPERPAAPAAAKAPLPKVEYVEHAVRQGDSLFNLAKRYGTTTEEIQRLNKVSPSSLSVGQVLKIRPAPAPASAAAKVEPAKTRQALYAVRNGDTIHSIAKRHHMTVERLLALNQLKAQSKLQPGQKLVVEN